MYLALFVLLKLDNSNNSIAKKILKIFQNFTSAEMLT